MLKADLHPARARSLKWDMLQADDFVLPPLPNHLFQRDNSCWIYRGVSVNPMAKPARQRERLHSRAIYRFHPMFATADFARYYGDDDASHLPATVEGGDVHVLGHGAVMIGMGERSTPMAVELLAQALFRAGQASTVIAVELPAARAMMHLDTVLPTWAPEDSQLGHKESMKDTARVLGRMFDGIEYRGSFQRAVETLGAHAGVPVWNGLTDDWHPTQMLANILTMRDHTRKPLAEVGPCGRWRRWLPITTW